MLLLCSEAERRANLERDFSFAATCSEWVGTIYFRRGQSAELKACADRAASYAKSNRIDPSLYATAPRLRGHWLELKGNFKAALEAYNEMIDFSKRVDPDGRITSISLRIASALLILEGGFDEAELYLSEALAIARRIREPARVAEVISGLAELALGREQWLDAERSAREGLALAENIRQVAMVARLSRDLAEALARQGRGAEGRPFAEQAVKIYYKLRSKDLVKSEATLAACQSVSVTSERSQPSTVGN